MSDIPVETLRQLLRYEPETGKLYWLERPVEMFEDSTFRHRTGKIAVRSAQWACDLWNTRFAGQEAFTAKAKSGAYHGKLFGALHYAHRVIWALHTDAWPTDDIDHINGNRADNRIENLRDVTHTENMRNQKVYRSSVSGHHGVAPLRRRPGTWQAYITINKKRQHIGYFRNLQDAIAARKAAEADCGLFHENHGRAA